MAKEICRNSSERPLRLAKHRLRYAPLAGAILGIGLSIFPVHPGQAKSNVGLTSNDAVCGAAAKLAARATGVPEQVLMAISLTETGRKRKGQFRSWPWTVNMEGKGSWFSDRPSALRFAKKNYDRGARSFDIGCFQINFKWHGDGFSSIDQMFDPNANALYAANYLQTLYLQKGNWKAAAGAYHSATPGLAARYSERFSKILANISMPSPKIAHSNAKKRIDPKIPRKNTYPLLRQAPGGIYNGGSLVASISTSKARPLLYRKSGPLF